MSTIHIKGCDLPGAVNVYPVGLGDILSKRQSKEYKMESNSESLNCSTLNVNGNENGENREKSIFNTQKESTWNMIGREFSTSIKTNEASSEIPGEFLQQDCLSNHGKEIGQENLKNALHSAICDLEIDLASKADLDNELPDLIHISQKGTEIKTERLRLPHEFKARPLSEPSFTIPDTVEPMNLPEVGSNNYHNTKKEVSFKESKLETRSSTIENTFSSSQLSKILTPSSDDGSLKRRNPHQMYTDSAFYNPKHHPSVAEQVEMAHRLSSSLYDEGNKKSHGQEMFLKRAKKSDLSSDEEVFPLHDRVPNMKLVMNPEGKIHDWSDLPEDEIPDIKNRCALGTTAEVAQFVIENLEQCKGRGGELFAKRRKRADKWVVDESSVGTNKNPSDFADNFVKQVRLQEEEKTVEMRDEQERKRERVSQREQKPLPIRTERTETSDFKKLEEMKFDSEEKKEKQSRCDISLPDGVAGCNLRSRAFTPTLDLSCHNTQGINVWATRAPKGFKVSWNDDCKASTLPRTTLKSVKGSFGDEKLPKFSNNNHNNESWSKYEEEKRQNEFYEQLEFESQEKSYGKLEEDSTSHRIQKKFDEEQSCMRESLKVPSVEIIPATPTIMETDFCKTKKGGSMLKTCFESNENLMELKRKEYESWFNHQKIEQQILEYDCSVQYEEKESQVQKSVKTKSENPILYQGEQKWEINRQTTNSYSENESSINLKEQIRQVALLEEAKREMEILAKLEEAKHEAMLLEHQRLEASKTFEAQKRKQHQILQLEKQNREAETMLIEVKRLKEEREKTLKIEKMKNEQLENVETYKRQQFQVEQVRQERQRMENERLEQMRIENERLECQRIENERLERQRFENERLEQIRFDNERLEQIRMENERLEQIRMENERLEQIRMENERIENERLEQIRMENEKLESQRIENERLQCQKIENERLERQRIENERLERQKIENERLEQIRFDNERLECQRIEEERAEKEKYKELLRCETHKYEVEQRAFKSFEEKRNEKKTFECKSLEETRQQQQQQWVHEIKEQNIEVSRQEITNGNLKVEKLSLEKQRQENMNHEIIDFNSCYDDENYFESYVNSLIPTTTGASIRQTGDIKPEFTTALMHEQLYKEQKRDREAFSQRSLKKTERLTSTSGVAKGSGSHSYEKHSVRNLVSRFSKVKREEVPLQYLPQHYRQNENAPPLSYLHEQARKRTFSFKEDTLTEPSSNVTQSVKQNNETNNQRRSSLKEYLYMNTEENVPVGQLLDPSSILRVDEQLEDDILCRQRVLLREKVISSSEVDKWDNHNTIARGWKDKAGNYTPVTFRKLYNVTREQKFGIPELRISDLNTNNDSKEDIEL